MSLEGKKRWMALAGLLALGGIVAFLLVRRSGAAKRLPDAGEVLREKAPEVAQKVPEVAQKVRQAAPQAARRVKQVAEQVPSPGDVVQEMAGKVPLGSSS